MFAFSAANLIAIFGLGLFLFVPVFILFWIRLFSVINFVYIGLSVYSPRSLFRDVLLFKFRLISIALRTVCLTPRSLLIRIVLSNRT